MTPAILLLAAGVVAYVLLTPQGAALRGSILGQTGPLPGAAPPQSDVGAIAGAVGAVANVVGAGLGIVNTLVQPSARSEARAAARDNAPREDLLRQVAKASKAAYRAMSRADVREWTIDSGGRISIWYFTKDSLETTRALAYKAQADDVIHQFSTSSGVVDPFAQQRVVDEKRRQAEKDPQAVIAWASSLGINPTLVGKPQGYGAKFGNEDPPDFVIPPADSGPIAKYAVALAFEPVVRVTGKSPQRGGRLVGEYIEFPPDEPAFHPQNPYAPPELRLDTLRREREQQQAAESQSEGSEA